MPPSGEKMWHTNYMDEYNKRRSSKRKTYNYRKPILKKTTPKATEIHVPNTYISQPEVSNAKPGNTLRIEDFLEPRPSSSLGLHHNDAVASNAFQEYFANLSLRGPDDTAVQDGHPSTTVPMFLDSYFPVSLSDIPSQEYYMWCLLNAAKAAQQKTQPVPKPPSTSRPHTAKVRPRTARPATSHGRPRTACSRPQTGQERPKTALERPGTAQEQTDNEENGNQETYHHNSTDEVDVLNLEAKEDKEEHLQGATTEPVTNHQQEDQKPREIHWLCWPEPEPRPPSPSRRPHTVQGYHKELPRYGNSGPDIEDRTDSPEPSYVFGVREESTRGQPLTFVPDLKAWINAASDYEKAVIYRMMQMDTMNSGRPLLPPPSLRPRRETTYTFGSSQVNNYPMPDPNNPYAQAWQPRINFYGSKQQSHVFDGPNDLPSLSMLQRSNTDLQLPSRRTRYPVMSDDYTHEHSMFMTTQPLVRGHFVIHPDWVSERVRRKPGTPFLKKYRNQGMRYGGK